MMAETANLEVIRGDTKKFNITVRDSSEAIFDLTGYSMKFTAKSALTLEDADAEISSTAVIANPATGIGAFTLTPTDTSIYISEYLYDIQISDGAANVYTIVQGTFTVTQDITRDI